LEAKTTFAQEAFEDKKKWADHYLPLMRVCKWSKALLLAENEKQTIKRESSICLTVFWKQIKSL
jgi:hypothetical protein